MGIKGLTDTHFRLPRHGKIRTGIKQKNAKGVEYATEVPYFIFNPFEEVIDRKGNPVVDPSTGKVQVTINQFTQKAIDKYGSSQVTQLRVVFPMDPQESGDLCISTYMKWWGDVGMKCIGDGQYAHYKGKEVVTGLNDPSVPRGLFINGDRLANRVCNRDMCPQALSKVCKAETNIRVLLPDVDDTAVFQIDTHSIQAIQELHTALDLIRNSIKRQGFKNLAGVPLIFYRDDRKNQHGGVNFIFQVRLDEENFKNQIEKARQSLPSTLHFGAVEFKGTYSFAALESVKEVAKLEEPNYDLLPQSLHGRAQTGDLSDSDVTVDPVTGEVIPKVEISYDEWINDPNVLGLFTKISEKTGTQLTKARMLSTARMYPTKEELVKYLSSKIS